MVSLLKVGEVKLADFKSHLPDNTSKPNERSCRILLEKKVHWPSCDPLYFLGKNFFLGFSEKIWKCFFNEIDCKKFANCFLQWIQQ